jgi:septal ring factor EnvC (AmiA/AmiB activator)
MDVVDGVPPRLGVELRRRGRPVNPLPWLAASSSKVKG